MTKIEDWAILLALPCIVLDAYLIAWRSGSSRVKRRGSALVAAITGFVGYYATRAYALPGLEELRHGFVSSSDVLGEIVMFAICIGALVVAVRHARLAIRNSRKSVT